MKTNLQRLRKAAGYKSARAFAEAHSIPIPTYTGHEQGTRSLNMDTAWKYADIFQVSLDELVGRRSPKNNYGDFRQEQMNHNYELLDERGKDTAAGSVAAIAAAYARGEARKTWAADNQMRA